MKNLQTFEEFLNETEVHYANSTEELESGEGNCYSDDIYTQRFYSKWVYGGVDYTMIMCDPHTDGVKWFRFFDNKKKVNP